MNTFNFLIKKYNFNNIVERSKACFLFFCIKYWISIDCDYSSFLLIVFCCPLE